MRVWSECSYMRGVSAYMRPECDAKRTSTVRVVGISYVKLPVLKSLFKPPIEIMSFALSTFSLTASREIDPT